MLKKKILLIAPLLFLGILVCLILGGKNQKIFSGEIDQQDKEEEFNIDDIRENIQNMNEREIETAIEKIEKEIKRLEGKLQYIN